MAYNIILGAITGADIIDLATAKMHSKISWAEEDALLAIYLASSQREAEDYIDGPIRERSMEIRFDDWRTIFRIVTTNVVAFSALKYIDPQGDEQTVDPEDYVFLNDLDGPQLRMMKDFDFPDLSENDPFPVRLELSAGWADDKIPESIKAAILLRFSHRNQYREDMPTSVDRSFQSLLRPFKKYTYGS